MRGMLAVAALFGLSGAAFADTLRVPQDHETIQAAADAASAGDTILVSRGIYDERVVVSGKDRLRFIGRAAVWDGFAGSKGRCLDATGNGIVVQGFRFRNGGVRLTGDDASVTRCTIRSANTTGLAIGGSGATVAGCTIVGCYVGIDISGARATITKNRVANMDDRGIELDGPDGEITRNLVKVIEDGQGIDVSGDRCVISRNTIVNSDSSNIEADGDDLVIEKNRCVGNGSYGIDVTGDGFRIVGNRISLAIDDTDGMDLDANSSAGGGLVEKNVVEDVVEDGIYYSGNNVTFRNNKVIGQGSEGDNAFYISGSGNTLEGCQAIDCEGDGFNVSGDGNTLTHCRAVSCLEDGFDIESGGGNQIIDCTAIDCDAEGVDNEGQGTVLRGGTFTGNRIDIANDVSGGATFATFAPGRYVTGGTDTQPEID